MLYSVKGFVFLMCFVLLFSCDGNEEAQTKSGNSEIEIPENPTFAEHIAPIIYANCTPCHRKGEAGPFELKSYKDVAKRSETIKYVIKTGFMPPWPADPDYRHFVGERYLEDVEKQTLLKWISKGSPLGDSSLTPTPPEYPKGSVFGEPDTVLWMKDTVWIKGNNVDHFVFIKIPFELPERKYIRMMEYVPGNRALAHHMNGHLINYRPGRKANLNEGAFWVFPDSLGEQDAYIAMDLYEDEGGAPPTNLLVCSYLPGFSPLLLPEGLGGYVVEKKAVFLMQDMHYGPSPKDTFDMSRINVWFSEEKPKRMTRETQMGTLGISPVVPKLIIPPDTIMRVETRYQVSQDISLIAVNPHMHLLGRSFKAYAITLKKDTIPLVSIPKWDFRWQFYYTFKKLLKIPQGSWIVAEGVYDNTEDNPYNPNFPPETVIEPDHSMKTTDEMFQLIFTYLPYEKGDEEVSLENITLENGGL